MPYLRHTGFAVRGFRRLTAATVLGLVATVAVAQGGLSPNSGDTVGGVDFATLSRVLESNDIEAAPGAVGFANPLAPDGAPTYEYRQIPGNGRGLFEIRLGSTTSAPSPIDNGSGLVIGAITTGPTAGTTSLIASVVDVNKLFDPLLPLPGFTTVSATGAIFSLGRGCQNGTLTDFPHINGNRPAIMRYNGTGFSVVVPTLTGIAPTNQYDGADCVVVPGTDSTVYVFSNRTLGRLEVWKDDASGFQPLQTTQLTGVATPFGGGLRQTLGIDIEAGDIVTVYQEIGGRTVARRVNVTTGAVGTACEVANSASPTGFTRPREISIYVSAQGDLTIIVGDFDNNGSSEIVRLGPGCARESFPAGSSAGGNGYNWNAYGLAVDEPLDAANFIWREYYVSGVFQGFAPVAATSPFPSGGGPFDAQGLCNRDGDRDVVSVAPGIAATQLFDFARGSAEVDRISVLGYEDAGYLTSCIRTTFSF